MIEGLFTLTFVLTFFVTVYLLCTYVFLNQD